MDEVGKAVVAYCRDRLVREYLPKIKSCCEQLGEEDLWWRAHETNNSIGNLLLHLSGNVRQWIISGVGEVRDVRERSKEFAARGTLPKAELMERLEATIGEADSVLAELDVSKLPEKRKIQGYQVTILEAILHVTEHFSQHVGQIIYITKLRRGVDLKFYDL